MLKNLDRVKCSPLMGRAIYQRAQELGLIPNTPKLQHDRFCDNFFESLTWMTTNPECSLQFGLWGTESPLSPHEFLRRMEETTKYKIGDIVKCDNLNFIYEIIEVLEPLNKFKVKIFGDFQDFEANISITEIKRLATPEEINNVKIKIREDKIKKLSFGYNFQKDSRNLIVHHWNQWGEVVAIDQQNNEYYFDVDEIL